MAAAAAYAERHKLDALLVAHGGDVAFERYGPGYDAEKPHALYSGTKSFWGALAVAAQDDGLLALDEPVAQTFPAWRSDAWKAKMTLRHLLQLTSGIGFGGLGRAVPSYEKALASELKTEPGTAFTYGGIPLQVFGAVLSAKLKGAAPQAYLHERLLHPIGLRVATWRTNPDGTQPLPTGAFLAAREWLKFGLFACARGIWEGREIVRPASFDICFAGSQANPRYGLCWWRNPLAEPADLVYASGAAGQALYVVPSLHLAIVKFGNSASYKHDAFLKRLFS